MDKASVILGNHAFFFREGDSYTLPSAGTCAREAKPDATDTGWIDLGILDSVTVSRSSEQRKIYAPTPGRRRLYNVKETSIELTHKLTLREMSALVWENLYQTLALSDASTQYNPLEGDTKRGWLKIQQYGDDDALFNTVDLFVHLMISGDVQFNDDIVQPEFDAVLLHSTLNTGTLA